MATVTGSNSSTPTAPKRTWRTPTLPAASKSTLIGRRTGPGCCSPSNPATKQRTSGLEKWTGRICTRSSTARRPVCGQTSPRGLLTARRLRSSGHRPCRSAHLHLGAVRSPLGPVICAADCAEKDRVPRAAVQACGSQRALFAAGCRDSSQSLSGPVPGVDLPIDKSPLIDALVRGHGHLMVGVASPTQRWWVPRLDGRDKHVRRDRADAQPGWFPRQGPQGRAPGRISVEWMSPSSAGLLAALSVVPARLVHPSSSSGQLAASSMVRSSLSAKSSSR